jgi:AcrR family transcriptional regulator
MRQRLSKAAVVQAGLDVLNEAGIDGVTVRAVASRLGVQAPALYWHVRDKQDLLDEMATEIWRRVTAELAALPDGQPWDQAMAEFAAITRRALLSHRDGAKVFSGTYLTDASVLQAQEAGLAQMIQQGFTLADVIRAYSLLYSFTVGFCIEEQAVAQAAASGDDRYSLARRAERLDGHAYPLAVQAGPEIFGDPDARFADLVGVIIDAASRMRT